MVTAPTNLERDVLIAMSEAHRLEVALLQTRIERLHALAREHDIPIPADDPLLGVSDGEHLIACRAVVTAAYALLERLDELREMVGSGMELIGGESWRRQ